MTRRRVRSSAQTTVVVGWTEVWSTGPDGFEREGTVPLELPRFTARFQDGRYRLRERKSLDEKHNAE